jgi:hypothetical protein
MTSKTVIAALLMLAALPLPCHAEGEGKAGAKLDRPVSLSVSGGYCESSGDGIVGANFDNALAFSIPSGTSHAPFTGPGKYQHVLIAGHPQQGVLFGGPGTVVVNPDRRTGTFQTDDGEASGSWDCGTPLQ